MNDKNLRVRNSVELASQVRDRPAVECAGNNTIAALIAGAIDAAAAERLEVHLDVCAACRQLVADLGRGLSALDEDRLPRPGDRLGRYEIERALGAGGMGVVFEARDTALGRRVAIKVVRPDSADRHTLLAEARAMARLAHPNVASIYDVGTVHGQLYLCMELVVGTSLREWLERPRSPREIIAMFSAAGRGLAYSHRCGLAHLDFKPDNVLVDRADRAVVTDFGVAALIGSARGIVAGTPRYMAPEQRRGCAADARADQFAFCTALGEALGRRAPSWARAVIDRGRSEQRGDRFATMDALLAALDAGMARRKQVAVVLAAALACVAITRPPVTRLVERTIARPVEHFLIAHSAQAPSTMPVAGPAADVPARDNAPPISLSPSEASTALLAFGHADQTYALTSSELAIGPGYGHVAGANRADSRSCDDGSELSCTTERVACPGGTTLAIADGCWTCVDETTCAAKGTPHVCDDGSPLRCTVARPTCSSGLVASVRGGCWQCADPFVCTARSVLLPTPAVATVRCGNGTCEPGETPTSCALDCHLESNGSGAGSARSTGLGSGVGSPTCGNGFCEIGEDHASCPDDCCELTSSGDCAPVCGNGFCEIAEDQASCPADCCTVQANGSCAP